MQGDRERLKEKSGKTVKDLVRVTNLFKQLRDKGGRLEVFLIQLLNGFKGGAKKTKVGGYYCEENTENLQTMRSLRGFQQIEKYGKWHALKSGLSTRGGLRPEARLASYLDLFIRRQWLSLGVDSP